MATTEDILRMFEQLRSQPQLTMDNLYARWLANVQFVQSPQWVRWDDIGVGTTPNKPFVPDYLKLPEGF